MCDKSRTIFNYQCQLLQMQHSTDVVLRLIVVVKFLAECGVGTWSGNLSGPGPYSCPPLEPYSFAVAQRF